MTFTDDADNEETLTSAATDAVAAAANNLATGAPTISGTPQVEQTLTADTSSITDEDGLTNTDYSYQWIAGGSDIDGATGSSYTLTSSELGKTIQVRVAFTDDADNEESLTSEATVEVTAAPNRAATGEPTISGKPQVDQTLTVSTSDIADEDGLNGVSYTYQWLADDADIDGATDSTYTLTDEEVGKAIKVKVNFTDDADNEESLTSGATAAVQATGAPTISDPEAYVTVEIKGGDDTVSWSDPGNCSSDYNLYLAVTPPANDAETSRTHLGSAASGSNEATQPISHEVPLSPDGVSRLPRVELELYCGEYEANNLVSSTRLAMGAFNFREGTYSSAPLTALTISSGTLSPSFARGIGGYAVEVPSDTEAITLDPTVLTGYFTVFVKNPVWGVVSGCWGGPLRGRCNYSYGDGTTTGIELSDADENTDGFQINLGRGENRLGIGVNTGNVDNGPGHLYYLTVTAQNSPATGQPTISGTPQVGQTLTADTSSISDKDGLDNVTYSYQWLSSRDTEIDGATSSTYAVQASDNGKIIKVRVTFTDDAGYQESLTSSATAVVSVETAFKFSLDGNTVACDSYNVHVVNVPYQECDDPSSIDQGTSGEIEVEIEITRSVNSQLYKFEFHVYQMEDRIGHYRAVEANDLCLGPGLVDSVSMEVTPDDGSGNFTYTDEGTIFKLCPAGTYQLYVLWYRYNYEDQEYEYAGTFRRYFFINGDDEEDTSVEQVEFITASYPDTPVSHGEVQIQGTKQSTTLNRTLTTFALSIDGLVPDSDTETTDYVVRVRIVGDGGPGKTVPWCHVGNVGYSYLLKTVPEDCRWEMDAHVLGNCLDHWWPDTLQVELFNGTDLTDYSTPVVFHGSNIISHTGELQYPEHGTHEFIAGEDISLGELPNSPATGAPTISGTPQVGETLTVNTSGIADANGMGDVSFSYQWLSSRDTEIDGATNSTYTLVSTDVGNTIKVKVSFTDDANNEETLTSAATATVAAAPNSDLPVVSIIGVPRPNSPATGAPTISGTAQAGQTLTADASGIVDEDGLEDVEFSYQWMSNDGNADTDIQDATASTYEVSDDDVGNTVKVRVSFTDDADNEETLTSAATAEVAARPNTPATGAPTINGTAQAGQTLTADTSGIDDEDGLTSPTYSYQWVRNDGNADSDIDGETASTYEVSDDDVGNTIKVRVSFTDDRDNEESLTSAATAAVTARSNTPPTGLPTISGTAQAGEALTAVTTGIADADGLTNAEFSYQWLADDADIQGAADSTYTLTDDEVGKAIKVRVTFTDDADNEESLTSAATGVVAAKPNTPATGLPIISGTAQAGETLTAVTTGIADADGLDNVSYSHQWLADDADISGATDPTYTLTDDDVGKAIRVKVSFTDDRNNEESLTSAATAQVTALPNNPATGAPTISGTAQAGETLTAYTSGITDADGLTNVSYSHQWLADDADIPGATDSTYTLTDDEVGKAIRVKVSFTDDRGNDETLTSSATDTVAARPDSSDTDAPPRDPSTTVDVTVGDTVKGEIEELHEVDWFRVRLLASETYRIDMRGAWGGEWALVDGEIVWISAGTLEDPKLLGVYSGANVLVPGTDEEVSGDDRGDYAEGKNSRIESFSPPADGYYYIAAAAEQGGWTGTYELTVTVVTEE